MIRAFKRFLRARQAPGIYIGPGARVDRASKLGAYSYISAEAIVANATIGRYATVGARAIVGPGEHDVDRLHLSANVYGEKWNSLVLPCEVGADAWIGANAVILRGARLGIGAVVGAGAVVTGEVPDFAIVGGVPAKLIRYRFTDETRTKLLASQWWLKDPEEARRSLSECAGRDAG